jgi:hypothetical protein
LIAREGEWTLLSQHHHDVASEALREGHRPKDDLVEALYFARAPGLRVREWKEPPEARQ